MLIFCSFSSSSLDTVIEVGECDAAGAMAGGLSAEAPPGPNLAVCMPCTTSKKGACVRGEEARNKEEGQGVVGDEGRGRRGFYTLGVYAARVNNGHAAGTQSGNGRQKGGS